MIKKFIRMCRYYDYEIKTGVLGITTAICIIMLIGYVSVQEISQDECKDLCESLGLVVQDYTPAHACFCCNHTIIIVNNQKFINSDNDCKLYVKYNDKK